MSTLTTLSSKSGTQFFISQLPSSEDDDVIAALHDYVDICAAVEEFINGEEDTKELKLHKLSLLQDMFSVSTTSPAIQSWFEEFRKYIEASYEGSNVESEGPRPGTRGSWCRF